MLGETLMRPEGVRHVRQRFLEERGQPFGIRDVFGDLAHPVHVIAHAEHDGWQGVFRQGAEGVADHGGAHHLAEGADVRQAGGTIARLQHHGPRDQGREANNRLGGAAILQKFRRGGPVGPIREPRRENVIQKRARLLEGPGASFPGENGETLKHAFGVER